MNKSIKFCLLFCSLLCPLRAQVEEICPHKTVMAFGVFDLLHPGHRAFLQQAASYGSRLIVVVAPDIIVQRFKKRNPCDSQETRIINLSRLPEVTEAILGDTIIGTYSAIKKYKPDIICLGYDQTKLGNDLAAKIKTGELPAMQLIYAQSFEPEKYHTSIILEQKQLSRQHNN
jgi:cytidyltransferase-like protein